MEEDTWNKIIALRANGPLSHFLSYFSGMGLSSPFFIKELWTNEYGNTASIYAKRKLKFCAKTRIRKYGIGIYLQWQRYVMTREILTLQKGNPKGTKWHNFLKRELLRLGNIGKGSHIGQGYIIGNCAEQHAGNNYMNKYHENNVSNLHFTEAVRPRTMQVFPSCANCKAVFPNL